MMPRGIVAALVLAASAWCLAAEAQKGSQPGVELGRRYFNLAEGYSLRPPAEATRVQERAASRTVTWAAAEPATGTFVWFLSVSRMPAAITADQLQAFAEQLRKEAKQAKLTGESCQVTTAAGRPAVDLRGLRTDKKQTWTRQVFILAEEGEFLTVTILGPAADRAKLQATHQAVLDSVEVLDRKALAAQREANLAAGRELLAGLTAEKLSAVLDPEDRWMLIVRDGQVVGFSVTRDRAAEVKGQPGVESRVWIRVDLPGGEAQRLEIVSVAAADRTVESWTATLRTTPAAGQAPPKGEEVAIVSLTKQGATIRFTQTVQGAQEKPTEAQRDLAEQMDRTYLPMAMQSLVSRLVDLGRPASYAFASYAPQANELDVYTFTVVGPEEIELDGRKVQAVRALVRPAEDVEEQAVWLDSAGRLLRRQVVGGEFLERSTRQEVLRRFPASVEMVKAVEAPPGTRPLLVGEEAR